MARIDKHKTLQAAQKHLGKGNLRKALEEYSKILKADPQNTNVRLKVAELQERLGDAAMAAAEYRRVARVFKAGGFYPKACALLNRVASLEPQSAEAHLELAELNQKLGRVAEALRHYQLATDVQDRSRDKRHSIDILKRIAEVGTPNLARSLEVAHLYYKEGFEQEGFEQFCQATADLDPASDEILEITLRMRQAWADDLRLKSRLGELHLARGEAKAAIGLFEEILARSRNAKNLALLAEAKTQAQKLDEARGLFQEAIAMYEADWDVEKRRELSARLIEISATLLESTTGEIMLTEVVDEARPAPYRGRDPEADHAGGESSPAPEAPAPEGPSPAPIDRASEDLDMLLAAADALLRNGKRSAAVETLERAAGLHPRESAPLLRLRVIYEESADWSALSELNRRIAAAPCIPGGDGTDAEFPWAPAPAAVHGEDPEVLAAPDSPLVAHAPAADAQALDEPLEVRAGDLDIQIVIDEKEMDGTRAEVEPSSAAQTASRVQLGTVGEAGFRSVLTGLPIRDLFLDRVDRAIARSERVGNSIFAVLLLDIDRFKKVNDAFGLTGGDELLVLVAQRLEKCLRKSDTAAYLGGDEFGILLENLRGTRDALRLARKISRRLAAAFPLDGREIEITASIGIALSTTGYGRPEAALQDAEAAMFRAKGNGPGLAEIFDESLRSRATAVLQLETDLRRAVEAGEFLIHYQPIVSLESGRVTGFEALARWRHPDGKLVAPNDFIPMAEEIALIGPIEKWLIAEACRRLREWQSLNLDGPSLNLGVNVSGKHLADRDFIGHLEAALSESAVDRGTLVLEVTESALIENAEILPSLFARLEKLQVRLCVDDFGSGLSSLPLLRRHPFAALKIDATAPGDGEGLKGADLVRALVKLAGILGAESVVKGVETARQIDELREMGCDLAQGHVFSPAVEESEVAALIGQSLPR